MFFKGEKSELLIVKTELEARVNTECILIDFLRTENGMKQRDILILYAGDLELIHERILF